MLKLYPTHNPPERMDEIVRTLRDGGVVVLPTDTTYAFAAFALKERAVERICRLAGINPATRPLSIVCYDMSAISEYAHISTPTYKTMKRNLPGPFTFILAGKNKLPKIFRHTRSAEVGIRMPDNPILREILHALDGPLLTASLPLKDDDPAFQTDPELINERYAARVDLIVDGGQGRIGKSTIIDARDESFEIIRQGDGELL